MDYYHLLVGQFEKKVDIKDRLTARTTKIGITSVGTKTVGQDKSYHFKNFKR